MNMDAFAHYWDEILSRDNGRIQKAFNKLTVQEKENTVEHLMKMSTEDDWHPAQIRSALIALRAIENKGKKKS